MESSGIIAETGPATAFSSNAQDPPGEMTERADKVTFELTTTEHNLRAFISAQIIGNAVVTLESVKEYLTARNICYGIVADEKINDYISQGSILQKPCLIAEGKLPEPGKDAQVTFYFERDPLKIGSIRTGGAIDFKSKGEIPQVKEGDLLAEKIPVIKEKMGMDVFGKSIPIQVASDIMLTQGPGTKRSGDSLKIFAQMRGRPELQGDGKVCVFPELRIKGDVGLETGHIRFDGFVDVEGAVQEGYKVKAGRLAAKEIYRAEIEVDGDVVVNGGIVGSKVTTRGNLKTRFIHSSQIAVLKDIIVESEIIDSKIETNGALIAVPSGKLFTSQITAKKGIAASQIGSKTSKPCTLAIGVDSLTRITVKNLEKEIAEKTEEKKFIKASLDRLTQGLRQLEENIIKTVQVQDQARQQYSLKKKMPTNPSQQPQAKLELQKLEEKVKSLEEPLQKLMVQQEQVMDKIEACKIRGEEVDGLICELEKQMQKALEAAGTKEFPPLKVTNEIYSGTILDGCHCSLTLKETREGALIKETKALHPSGEGSVSASWEMQISALPA